MTDFQSSPYRLTPTESSLTYNQTDYVITKLAEEQATGDETSYKSDLEKYSEIITKRKAAREEIDALRKEE
jgi:hypothetical protein